MIVRNFDLIGPVLRVEADVEAQVDQFGRLLRGLAIETDRQPAFTLSIRQGEPVPVPSSARTVYEGPIFWEGDCVYAADGALLHLLFPGRISLVVDTQRNFGEIVAAPGEIARVSASAGMLALDAAIDASGQFLVHAAGLTLPGSDDQVLIFAPSGTGKSTTSLALASQGFGLCADDSMVVRIDGAAASGWGLPRDLKVHRKTAEMMPWLRPYLTDNWNEEEEQGITRAALADSVRVEAAARRRIAGVFILERGDVTRSLAAPLGQTDTLVALAADNVRTGKTGLLASHRRRFSSLAALASSTPTFRVTVGSEPESTAQAIADAVGHKG